MTGIEPRPLSAGQILDSGLKIYLAHWWTFMRTVLYVVAPLGLISALIVGSAKESVAPGQESEALRPTFDGDDAVLLAASTAWILLTLIQGTLASAACYRGVMDVVEGRSPDVSSSLTFAVRRFGPVLWATLLVAFFTLLGLLVLVVGALFVTAALCVTIPALLTEDVRGLAALRRSWALVKGRLLPTLGVLLLATVLAFFAAVIVGAIVGTAVGAVTGTESLGAQVFVQSIANIAAGVVTAPFSAAVLVVLYHDLKLRKAEIGPQ